VSANWITWIAGLLTTLTISTSALAQPQGPEGAVVFIAAGYVKNGSFVQVSEASGFVVHKDGWVATAKHLTVVSVPEGELRVFRGSLASRKATSLELFEIPGPVTSADIALLRFPPALGIVWPYLKILSGHSAQLNQKIVAHGFPLKQDLTARPGEITSLMGPMGSLQVNAGFAPGMSGGPVLLAGSRCVIGVVAGGSGYPGYDFVTPIQSAKSLLDQPPAEFVTIIASSSDQDDVPEAQYERSYQIDETNDEHNASKSSKTYTRTFQADPNATIISARYSETSQNGSGDKVLNIGADRKSVEFRFRLESGPFYDRWRGWWHGQVILTQQHESTSASRSGPDC
jgi:S1-C subfamily serine protease